MTRGIFIGEIVDSLSNLSHQVAVRCSLGFFDLNKLSEDFFCRLLNLTYGYNLTNLNKARMNEPGLDLGDETEGVAFQITSQADSAKINATLEAITDDQKQKFQLIKIFIIGEKQGSYTAIKQDLINSVLFTQPGKKEPEDFIAFHIVDIKYLLRDIISLELNQIHEIYKYMKNEIQNVSVELEIPRADGSYPTTLLSSVEVTPQTKSANAGVILNKPEFKGLRLADINRFFDKLSSVPRVTREAFYFIVNYGEIEDDTFSIYFDEAVRKLNIPERKLMAEAMILERRGLIYSIDEIEPKLKARLDKDELGAVLDFVKETPNLYKFIVSLDFTILDTK